MVNARKLVEDVRAGRANYDFVEVRASGTAKVPLFQAVFLCVEDEWLHGVQRRGQ